MQEGVSFWLPPQQPLSFKGIRKSKACWIFVRRKYLASCLDKAGEVGLGQWDRILSSWSDDKTGNRKHNSWHSACSSDHWSLKHYWNLTENNENTHADYRPLPVSEGERADEFSSLGKFVPCLLPSVLCQKCIQCWSSAIYNMCHFVSGRAEVTKWCFSHLFHFIYRRPALIKHGSEIILDFPFIFFYCFYM